MTGGRTRCRLLLRPQLWGGLWLIVSVLLAAMPAVTGVALSKAWLWLTALTLASLLLGLRPRANAPIRSIACVAVLLPPGEQRAWVAEVAAVLDAAEPGPERRRQLRGYLWSLPATAFTTWRIRLHRR